MIGKRCLHILLRSKQISKFMKQNFFRKVDIKGRVRVCLETVISQGVEGKTIVDVGSSIGWLEEELLKYRPKKIVGIEPDPGAVNFAKRKIKAAQFFIGSAEDIPLSSSFADIVTMFDVLEHVPKDKEHLAVKEAFRVLKPKGKLVLSTPNYHLLTNILDPAWYFGHRHYDKKYLRKVLTRAEFKVERLEIRGGIWFSVYLIWHYVMKWVLRKPFAVNKYMIEMDDVQFSKKNGIHTIFLVARKL